MFLLKLALSLLCATTYTSTTTAANSVYSTCTRDTCNCLPGTHEATLVPGLKYCATDSTEKCMEFAVRLSPKVCECKKGYKFNVDRTKCFPMTNRIDDFVDRFRDELWSTTTTSFVGVDKTTTKYENNAGNTTTSDGNNSNEVPTEDPLTLATKPELDTEKCMEFAVRLSPKVCECKKGYKFNVDRTKCFPMDKRIDDFVDRFRDELSNTTTTSFVDVDKTTTKYENNAGNTTTSDGNNSNEVPTELDNSKSFYIWIGVALTGTALLVFLASLCYISKRK